MNRPSRKLRRSAGMSMIEVLAAVLLVSFGILGLLTLLAKGTQAAVNTEDNQRAAMLASELASTMWTMNTVSINASTLAAWNARVGDAKTAGLPGGVGMVVMGASNVARITVKWTPPSGAPRAYVTDVVIVGP
ncbi:MAG TPA: fimbrial assembly protein [Burkholderiaceae bacterium]